MADDDDSYQLPLSWIGYEEEPIQFANQFLVQIQPGEIVIALGQVTPPAVLGTPEEQKEQIKGWPFVPVRVAGRYGLTRARLEEFRGLLNRMADEYDRQFGG